MSQDKDLPIVFLGGMDTDTEMRSVADGDFIDALNTRNGITDQANKTAVENVRGNILVTNNYLTNGTNKVIGSFEDNKDNSIIYCVYNSKGYHGIYRYYRNKPAGSLGTIEKLLQINYPSAYSLVDNPLNFQPDYLITGIDFVGDKLYFTDAYNRSRKINTDRANETSKRRKFKAYFNASILTGVSRTFTINVYDSQGVSMTTPLTWSSTASTLLTAVDDLISAYHVNQQAVGLMNITSFGEYIEIEMTSVGAYYITFTDTTNTTHLVVPDNFYPDKQINIETNAGITTYDYFSQDLIDRLKYPALKEPQVQFKTDLSRNTNLVRQKVFQFRTQYVYDDDEKSVWSAISIVPLASASCDENIISLSDNYIEVDFTDPRLNNPSLMSIIKRVNISVREHNEGDWQIIDSLEPWQWGIGRNIYKFYNDKLYTQLSDQADFIRPYDALFIKHKALKLVSDRLFDGNGTEGYDKVKVNAKIDTTYTPAANTDRYTIKGVLFIRGIYATDGSPGMFYQPIHRYDNNQPVVFGGFEFDGISVHTGKLVPNRQSIPTGGWPVYLAGTDYYGVTYQQQIMPYGTPIPGAQYTEGTAHPSVFATVTSLDQLSVESYLSGIVPVAYSFHRASDPFGLGYGSVDQNGKLIGDTNAFSDSTVFSYFEIQNVPAGEYVLRVADHMTTADQLTNGSRQYQKTSANVLEVGGFNGAGGDGYEAKIKVDATTAINGIVYVGRTSVADTHDSCQIQGYVTDHDNNTVNTSDYGSMTTVEQTRVERSLVTFDALPGGYNGLVTTSSYSEGGEFIRLWTNLEALTDHNGYFFFSTRNQIGTTDITSVVSGAYTLNFTNKVYDNNAAWAGNTTNDTKVGVFRNDSNDVSTKARTVLNGKVVSVAGSGVPQVLVINTHGAVGFTDFTGDFRLYCYIDMYRQFITGSITERNDSVIFSSGDSGCLLTFDQGDQFDYDIHIDVTVGSPPPYDNIISADWYIIPQRSVTLVSNAVATSAFKKGGDIQFGIVYFDEGDRRTAVCTGDELKIHFPFPTETGGNTGVPVVSWSVSHEPPSWAKKWQWVRTKNTQLNYYLQWMVDKVDYVLDDSTTVTSQATAPKIKIWISNFAKYKAKHPNSTLSYTFSKGDRVRFFGIPFTAYNDYEILEIGVNGDYFTIYNDFSLPPLQAGYAYEIYSPRDKQSYTLFYEFGETYEVGVAYINGLKKYYHKGQLTNQSYQPAPVVYVNIPATGKFKTGDAYYRLRTIPVNTTSTTSYRSLLATDAAVSDFYDSEDESIGRTNTSSDEIGQIYRPTAIRFTDRYIENTKVNGLSTVQPLNQKQLSTNYGAIMKLLLLGDDVLMSIHENSKIVTMYVDKNVLRQAAGTTPLVALSDEVLPQSTALMQTYGTENPESVMVNDDRDVFMWDKQVATVPRYTGNALTAISDFKMTNYFQAVAEIQKKYSKEQIQSVAVYDRLFDEYILSFNIIPAQQPKKASARVCIPDTETTTVFTIISQPDATLIAMFTVTTSLLLTVPTGAPMVNAINAGGSGYSAILDPVSGCVDVFAPTAGSSFNNKGIVVTMDYDIPAPQQYSLQFEMTGGTD